jgi:hypothetical protein
MQKEFNVNQLVAELDEEFSEEPAKEVAEDTSDPAWVDEGKESEAEQPLEEEEAEEPEVEEDEEAPEPEEEEKEEETPHLDDDLHRRNEAFKKLREERDQLAASDKFLSDLASQYGLTKEQLIKKYTEELTEKQAKEAGIDPKQFKKMQELENKVAEIEAEKNREVFNLKAGQLANKYNLNDKEMMNLFSEAQKLNIDILTNPDLLEFAYKAANYEKALEMGRQEQLKISKKRRSTSVGKPTSGSNVDLSDYDEDKEIENYLKENNIIRS